MRWCRGASQLPSLPLSFPLLSSPLPYFIFAWGKEAKEYQGGVIDIERDREMNTQTQMGRRGKSWGERERERDSDRGTED